MKPTEDGRHEPTVGRFRGRLLRLLVVERMARYLAVAGFAWGAVALVARAGLGASVDVLWPWGVAAAAAAAAAALVAGLRALPPKAAVRTLLDRRQGLGGLLMAADEVDLGGWAQRVERPVLPRLVWRSGPALGLIAGAAAFVALALFLPVHPLEAAPRSVSLGEEVDEIAERLELLEEEGLLDEAESERLAEELDALAEGDAGEDPARAWEALDHLRELTEETAAEAAEAAFAEGERLAAASAVAEALGDGTAGDPALRAAALADLAALAGRAAGESQLLDESLAQALREAAAASDLGRLAEALGAGKAGLNEKLQELYDAGMIDLETLLEAQKSLAAEDASLADFLDENGLEAAGAMCRGTGTRPGRGGVSRGRGDAPMTWRDPVTGEGIAFENERLAPASLGSLHESGVLGLSAADPTAAGGPRGAPSAAGSAVTAASGGAAHTQTVLPRHRGAVRRFFDRSGGEAQRAPPERDP